ncbi:MAG: sugar-binding transcriptional regulator, partial [Candidatus Marinimicrobia bacterium]|nr:sugar-binding transcriptional regulator [Candidatus Neomarinimicrobiota bacterium]
LTQQQISEKLGISRPGVSRLLSGARNHGIVHIKIVDPFKNGTRLENALKKRFNLKKVIIVPADKNSNLVKKRLGKAAVLLLDKIVEENIILGISWGTTMQEVARQLHHKPMKNTIVVQLNGGISRAEYDTHASEIAQVIGEKYNAVPYLLPLPAIVDSPDLKNAIVFDRNINRTLKLSKKADIAMFTIGSFDRNSVLVKADYFEKEEVESLIQNGAVGDICSRIISSDGKICSQGLDARTIGIELEEIREKPYSIAVAGGKKKFRAIQAGLRGNWFNCLITDESVAEKLLDNE